MCPTRHEEVPLPPNSITIRNGTVRELVQWAFVGRGNPEPILKIVRHDDQSVACTAYYCGENVTTTNKELDVALKRLHVIERDRYKKLFLLSDASAVVLKTNGYDDYHINVETTSPIASCS